MKAFLAVLAGLAGLGAAHQQYQHSLDRGSRWGGMWHLPGRDHQPVPGMGNSTFSQLIDHKNPKLGTFEQFYMYVHFSDVSLAQIAHGHCRYDTTYYKGPGSPIVLFTPGEINATGYTSYLTTNRKYFFEITPVSR